MKSARNTSGVQQPGAFSNALDLMWNKFLPEIRSRARVLQEAAEAAAAGGLGDKEREAAQSAAHKLAGTLGTFGLSRGTQIARELESIYGGHSAAVAAERLAAMAAEIENIIDSRKRTAA